MGTNTVDQAKLVTNVFAARLQNELVTRDVVTWNMFTEEMDDRNGLKVVEQRGPRYAVTRTENGVRDLTTGTQGSVWGGELYEITGTFGSSMGWGDFQKIKDIGSARESEALLGAAQSMAQKIDAYILSAATLASNNWTGTVGNNLTDQEDVVAGYTRLKEQGVQDGDMNYVMNWVDRQKLGDQVINLPGPDGFPTATYKDGLDSRINGIGVKWTQQLPVLTVGTRAASGAAQVSGATQNVNYADVATQTTANGLYKTQTLSVKNMTAAHTIAAGEVFTIAGVYAYDNQKQALVSPARLQQFTVVTAATADGSGLIAALRIYPAIIVPNTGTGSNPDINTAHATVDSIPANSAAMTFMGTASTAYAPRLLIQKGSMVVNSAQLVMPMTGISSRKTLSKIPLSVRMWGNSEFSNGSHDIRFDVALNVNVRDRDRLTRINGS